MEYIAENPILILDALSKLFPDSSKRTLLNWLKNGRFSLNGDVVTKKTQSLEKGDKLSAKISFQKKEECSLEILYEDEHLVAINKPIHLLSVPLDLDKSTKSALTILKEYYKTENIYAVHRIDRETSGALLFARSTKVAEKLNVLFANHDLKREYFAIVHGDVKEQSGTWECPLLELENFHVIESDEGKMATTHFNVHRRSKKYTYLHFVLETGKKHQIRVHCKRAGHPIVGDKRYGSTENPLKRLCLHAKTLELIHPLTQKKLHIEAELPKSFQVLGGQI